MKKLLILMLTVALVLQGTAFASVRITEEKSGEEVGFAATFITDGGAKSVIIYQTQDTSSGASTYGRGATVYARNSVSGDIDVSGDGQINFKVVTNEGYKVSSVEVSPANYKNLKIVDEENSIYRITKVTGDITVTVTTEELSGEAVVINGVSIADNAVTAVDITVNGTGEYSAYIGVYDSENNLLGIRCVSAKNAATELEALPYEPQTQSIRVFVWDENLCPAAEVYEYRGDGIIHLNGTSVDAAGISGIEVSGANVTITAAGEYTLKGTLSEGQITVATGSKSDEVVLNLDNVSVTSSTGNALNATKGAVTLANVAGSTSTFVSTYSTDTDAGVGIYSKNDLTVKGADASTKIIAKSTAGNAVRCKADLEIGTGDMEVEAGNHGIKGDESVKFTKKTGRVTVTAAGDAIKTDAIDADTLEIATDSSYAPKGIVTVNGGTFELNAKGDAIQADYGFVCANSPVITINSGTEGIKVNTAPTQAWYYADAAAEAVKTIQGFVQIDGGTFNITSGEDAIKAADFVRITGGDLTIDSTLDAIQSGVDYIDANGNEAYTNGNLTIDGGTFNIKTHGGSLGGSTTESCKGIKAINDLTISGGDFILNCCDDAIHSNYNVNIKGGTFEIATGDDGIHADYTLTMGSEGGSDEDYAVNISTSYEGLEASLINYLSGTTNLYATDDGVNAAGDYEENGTYHGSASTSNVMMLFGPGGGGWPGNPGGGSGGPNHGMEDNSEYGMLYIKGGKLYIVANGDGLDSNGSILMNGGTVVVNGTTSGGNGVFDKGDKTGSYFKVTGGTLVGFGTTDMPDNPTVSGQSYLNTTTSLTKGSVKNVMLSSGKYLGIVPEITLSRALLFVTAPDMSSSGAVYSGAVSYTDINKLIGRTVNNTWYGVYKSDYDNGAEN